LYGFPAHRAGPARLLYDFFFPDPAAQARLFPPLSTMTATPSALPILILHTGDPDAPLMARHGGYADQLRAAAGLSEDDVVRVAVFRGERPDAPSRYRAALITGSPANVTDHDAWGEQTAPWLREAAAAGLPMFGVCYGHQLMAYALGGQVDYNPAGREVGTQAISLTDAAHADAMLQGLPDTFPAQTLHEQTVLALPPGARVLARSAMDPHQMIGWTPTCYSTQFHPEFAPAFIREHLQRYAEPYREEGIDIAQRIETLTETPESATLVRRFLQTHAAA